MRQLMPRRSDVAIPRARVAWPTTISGTWRTRSRISRRLSRRTVGREISQILLLHANSLNADHFGALAELLTRRGYRFISLTQALEDPAYRLPDEFTGAPGNSWFNHWEITAGREPVPTPAPSSWVTPR